ncbi:hypothetical protein Phi46:3_gp031 [Cellulophaga phage phi46:3]|uniref:Uncharacterized protein n=1 Tax=Cellulophaga phage phi46:3 TaxID=1327985 RepID=S0A1U4_9CAUD|nr:hypothetical protein Phi46:3_gp031 [Cellulophaga phage phi46:3]AGO48775.1 hypothetical protein Phi46:3_gp031 [Cellulophaga phage phi46:3]
MELKNKIEKVLKDYGCLQKHKNEGVGEAYNQIRNEDLVNDLFALYGVMCSLNLAEIENLVRLKHYDDSDFGWDKKACEEMREESRKSVGYTKADLENYT